MKQSRSTTIDLRVNKKAIIFYLLMLLTHLAHIFEEIWGQFFLLNVFGLGLYLTINWILFIIPFCFFYYFILGKNWARILSIGYAGLMILQGIGHLLLTFTFGRYHDGFAGGFTGIGLAIIGIPLIFFLR